MARLPYIDPTTASEPVREVFARSARRFCAPGFTMPAEMMILAASSHVFAFRIRSITLLTTLALAVRMNSENRLSFSAVTLIFLPPIAATPAGSWRT